MAIKLELDLYLAEKLLRPDILRNLSFDGMEAVIEHYNNIGEDIDFDQSLFWCFHRYESPTMAAMDHDESVVYGIVNEFEEENPDEPLDRDYVNEKCLEWLNENTICIKMKDGSVVINTEF